MWLFILIGIIALIIWSKWSIRRQGEKKFAKQLEMERWYEEHPDYKHEKSVVEEVGETETIHEISEEQKNIPDEPFSGEYKIFRGNETWAEPMAIVIGNKVYPGKRTWEPPVMNISGDKIYDYEYSYSTPVAYIKGKQVFGVDSWVIPIATIKNNKVYEGEKTYKDPIATFEGEEINGAVV